MPARNALVLADDATGALECASLLAGMGLAVSLQLRPGAVRPGVCVADTESRHRADAEAAACLVAWLPAERIYKKTDSTLRGPIGAELTALARFQRVVYIPAYPALGRTVVDGMLYVDGTPVAETAFGADARQPVRSSAIRDLFPGQPICVAADDVALAEALRGSHRIIVCDAGNDADLDRLAEVLRQAEKPPAVAGPAGFLTRWAGLFDFARTVPAALPRPNHWLVVCGSLHPQSRRQAEVVRELGLPVMATDTEAPDSAAALAARCVPVLPEAVVVMGGDTVWALWRALGVETVTPLPEVLPGVAACLAGGRLFVTKAGGFGGDRLVEQVLAKWR